MWTMYCTVLHINQLLSLFFHTESMKHFQHQIKLLFHWQMFRCSYGENMKLVFFFLIKN